MVIALAYVYWGVNIVAMAAVCLLCALSVVANAEARLFQRGEPAPKTDFSLGAINLIQSRIQSL
ncbi:hypothetical protein VV97_22505, partial [Vibrio vulnificus]